MKKYFILIGAVIAVVITTVFAYVPRATPALKTSSQLPSATTTPIVSTSSSQITPRLTPRARVSFASTTAEATLKVGATSYALSVTPNETLIEAMTALASTSAFIFTSHAFPGLGEFIDSIDGIANTGGKYWMLYVNGTSASSGASSIIINPDDVAEWRYEKSNY